MFLYLLLGGSRQTDKDVGGSKVMATGKSPLGLLVPAISFELS